MTNGHPISRRRATPWWRALGLGALTGLLPPALVAAFLWPLLTGGPDDVPLAVAGPAPAVEQVTAQLEQSAPGAFEVLVVADGPAAEEAVTEREAYGAIVLSTAGPPEVLVATAASPAVARLLTDLAGGLAASGGAQGSAPGGAAGDAAGGETPPQSADPSTAGAGAAGPVVTDLAPPPPGDPVGSGIAAGSLPLVLGGLALGMLAGLMITGVLRRLVAIAAGSVSAGAGAVLVLHGWLDALGGDPVVEAAVVALGIAAVAATLAGLAGALGRAGLGLGPVLFVLLGNPLSGAQTAPELLPAGWGALGQALPPGALVSLLRAVSGFDGAGALTPTLTLAAWLAVGLVLMIVGAVRERAGHRSDGSAAPTPTTPPGEPGEATPGAATKPSFVAPAARQPGR